MKGGIGATNGSGFWFLGVRLRTAGARIGSGASPPHYELRITH